MSGLDERSVQVTRRSLGRYEAVNARGVRLLFGSGGDDEFSPVELFLAAIAGCGAADVDHITAKRAEPVTFELRVRGEKVRDQDGNRLEDISLTFDVTFPEGEAGDAARAVLPSAVQRSHDRLCTVSRTVERGTAISTEVR